MVSYVAWVHSSAWGRMEGAVRSEDSPMPLSLQSPSGYRHNPDAPCQRISDRCTTYTYGTKGVGYALYEEVKMH